MDPVEKALAHFGIPGMKWGVRRSRSASDGPAGVETTPHGQIRRLIGGRHAPASEDAIKTAASKQKVKKSGTQALSTKELQDLVLRMNLEQQLSGLRAREPSKFSQGMAVVKQLLGVAKTGQEIFALVNSPAGKAATTLGAKLIKDSLK